MSRLTPEARAIGPARLQAIASSRLSVPIPFVRSTKMRFLFSRSATSCAALGMSSLTNCFTIRLKVFSSGRSMFSPPTRVHDVWNRWPLMNSTMS